MRPELPRNFGYAALLGVLFLGCQVEQPSGGGSPDGGDGSRVRQVAAEPLEPNVMLLVDKSATMSRAADPRLPACRTGPDPEEICGAIGQPPCDEEVCPTRLKRMQEALGTFLKPAAENPRAFRVALAAYPVGGQCAAPSRAFVDFPLSERMDARVHAAGAADAYLQSLRLGWGGQDEFEDDVVSGGTPTAASLRFLLEGVPGLHSPAGRADYVLLVTDGLPNCNADHPVTSDACRCTLNDPSLCETYGLAEGCLDDVATVAAIRALAGIGITTIVVGVGNDLTTPLGAETLQAMGTAGGFIRTCEDDEACGAGDSCVEGACARSYLSSPDGSGLEDDLRRLSEALAQRGSCVWRLTQGPEEGEHPEVALHGEVLPQEVDGVPQWRFDVPSRHLTFEGEACRTLEQLPPEAAMDALEVSYVQQD